MNKWIRYAVDVAVGCAGLSVVFYCDMSHGAAYVFGFGVACLLEVAQRTIDRHKGANG